MASGGQCSGATVEHSPVGDDRVDGNVAGVQAVPTGGNSGGDALVERSVPAMEDFEEEELMPGVFLMKRPQGAAAPSGEGTAGGSASQPAQALRGCGALEGSQACDEVVKTLEDFQRDLFMSSNACLKLIESQEAIREAMVDEPDPVYDEAIAENREVIARLQAEVLTIKEEMFAKFRMTPILDERLLSSEVVEEAGVFL